MVDRVVSILLRSSLMWGLCATVAFYLPLYKGLWKDELILRYCASNWLECVEVGLFFTGMASLLLRLVDVLRQAARLHLQVLPPRPREAQAELQAGTLLAYVEGLPSSEQKCYLARRLRDVLRATLLKGNADDLADDLRYLAESDSIQAQSSQAPVRVIIWAIPVLGLLGTMAGLTTVAAGVDAAGIDEALSAAMRGLGIAFDTTALGLALSMALVFLQSFVDRLHQRLLAGVEQRASEELSGRFERTQPAVGTAGSTESWLRLEPLLRELLRITKAQHEVLLQLGPQIAEAAAVPRADGPALTNAPALAMRALAEHPEQAVAALVQMIVQFNVDVSTLQQDLPAPLSFAGARDLLPVRLGPGEAQHRVCRRRRITERRRAA